MGGPRDNGLVGPKRVSRLERPSGKQHMLGPEQPTWKCERCGTHGIYANRISCHKCFNEAPRSVLDNARKQNDKAAKSVEPTVSQKSVANGKKADKLQKDIDNI